MSEKIYDRNFLKHDTAAEGTADWYEVSGEKFDIYGLIPEKDGILTRRIPVDVAEKVSKGVLGMSGHGAGGRIRFSTDSSFVAIKVEYANGALPTVCK